MRLRGVLVAMIAAISVPAHAYRIALWIPPWSSAATTSIQLHAGSVTESNPVWYVINPDGSIARVANAESPSVMAAMTGTRVVPTIQNVIGGSWSGPGMEAMLADPAIRAAHIEAIFQLVTSKAYDGIDIDYEAMRAPAQANFTAFVTSLAERLHSAGKTLSVTVSAKTSVNATWSGPGAENYPAIGAVADSVKVMAYDYSWSTSPPGPIAPLSWIDKVVTYAESTIPPAKLYIGLPFFGYDWLVSAGASKGAGVSFASATSIAQTNGATIAHSVDGEATFTYGGAHTVFFQDAFAYTQKIELILQKHPAVGGFAHWAAGQEDPAIWDVITKRLFGNPAQPPAADFAISGPSSLAVQQGSATAAEYRLTAVNGFNGSAAVSAVPSNSFTGSVQLSAESISVSSPVTLTVLPGNTAPGVHPITLRFTAGSISHDQIVAVTVTAPAPRSRAVRH